MWFIPVIPQLTLSHLSPHVRARAAGTRIRFSECFPHGLLLATGLFTRTSPSVQKLASRSIALHGLIFLSNAIHCPDHIVPHRFTYGQLPSPNDESTLSCPPAQTSAVNLFAIFKPHSVASSTRATNATPASASRPLQGSHLPHFPATPHAAHLGQPSPGTDSENLPDRSPLATDTKIHHWGHQGTPRTSRLTKYQHHARLLSPPGQSTGERQIWIPRHPKLSGS